jgi:hypothetical protein
VDKAKRKSADQPFESFPKRHACIGYLRVDFPQKIKPLFHLGEEALELTEVLMRGPHECLWLLANNNLSQTAFARFLPEM